MQNPAPKTDSTLSILQLVLSGVGLALILLVTVVLLAVGAGALFLGPASENSVSMFSRAVAALAIGLALVPPALLAIARLQGRPLPALRFRRPFRAASLALALWPVVIALGWLATRTPQITWVLLPPLQILAVAIPVWWLFELGRRGLGAGSLQRSWGMLSFGLLPNPILIILLELVVLVALVVVWAVWISGQPGQAEAMRQLSEQLRAVANDPQAMLDVLQPLLAKPGTVLAIIAIGGVTMPLLEELFKPLALWLLAGRITHPAQGFVLGMIGGAAFALVESLNLTNAFTTTGWVSVVMIRSVTGLLHITTSGLVGWGLASAWTQGRYGRLALAFLSAVAIHGAWNSISLLIGFDSVLPIFGEQIGALENSPLGWLGPGLLAAIALGMLGVLLVMNARLRRDLAIHPEPVAAAPAPLTAPELPPEDITAPVVIESTAGAPGAPGEWSAEWPAEPQEPKEPKEE